MLKTVWSFAVILALLFTFESEARAQVKEGTSVITAETQLYLRQLEVANRHASKRGTSLRRKEAKLFVVCTPDADIKAVKAQMEAVGVHPQAVVGRCILLSAPVDVVSQLSAIEGIHYITKGPRVSQKTQVSREVTGVNQILGGEAPMPQAFTGKNVVVGIIDKGFDFTHPVFADGNNDLRIKAVYVPGADGAEPFVTADGDMLSGTVITDPQQILALKTDNGEDSHGTHCASIAAGSHFTIGDNVVGGMAPDADIVLCPYMLSSLGGDGEAPEFTGKEEGGAAEDETMAFRVINSILFIRDYAQRQGKPCVISMSLNSHDGAHDGTSLISSMFEQFTQNGVNLVLASGNEGGDSCYISRVFTKNDTLHTILPQAVQVSAFSRQPSELSFNIGLFNVDTMQEEWQSPLLTNKNGSMMLFINFATNEVQAIGFSDTPGAVDNILNTMCNVHNGVIMLGVATLPNGHSSVQLQTIGMLQEPYLLTFHLTSPEGNTVDMWGDNGTTFVDITGSGYYTTGSSSMSLGDRGTGGNTITVGSWVAKSSYTNMKGEEMTDGLNNTPGSYSTFSSYGTDLAGHTEPFITAPGSMVTSAINSYDPNFINVSNYYTYEYNPTVVGVMNAYYCWASMSGTSMATPTVAGIIALWLEAKPDLTYEEIKEALAVSAVTDNFTDAYPIRYGHGKIDAYGGLLHILGIPSSIPELSRHHPQGINFRLDGSRLVVDGAPEGTPIRVYTTGGFLITSSVLQDGSIILPSTAGHGVYAVQVGNLGSTLIRK